MHLHSRDQQSSRELVAGIMRDRIGDEALAGRMVPDFALGCRRMTPGSGYLESLTRDNVHVVHDSVVRLTEKGVVDAAGVEHEVDVVVSTGTECTATPTGAPDQYPPFPFSFHHRSGSISNKWQSPV